MGIDYVLEMLELLLSVTEELKPVMNAEQLEDWTTIAADTADVREQHDAATRRLLGRS